MHCVQTSGEVVGRALGLIVTRAIVPSSSVSTRATATSAGEAKLAVQKEASGTTSIPLSTNAQRSRRPSMRDAVVTAHVRKEIDLGCGTVELEATCTRVDASYMFFCHRPPPLCDCGSIGDAGLCQVFASDCSWSEERAQCKQLD